MQSLTTGGGGGGGGSRLTTGGQSIFGTKKIRYR